jgi:hypothetical protein
VGSVLSSNVFASPIGLCGVLIHTVRERAGHDRREVVIADRPLRRRIAEKGRSCFV